MREFPAWLLSLVQHPARNLGKGSIAAVCDYFPGSDHASGDVGHTETPLDGWRRRVQSRLLIAPPAWPGTGLLRSIDGRDRAGIKARPQRDEEFLAERATLGVEGIADQHRRRFLGARRD